MPGKIVRGASIVFVSRIVTLGTQGLLILLLTRVLLQPAEYGLLFLTISVLSVAMLFANLGFSKSGARYIAEFREVAPELVSTVVRKTVLYNGLTIAVVCVVVFLFRGPIASFVGEPSIATLLAFGTLYIAFRSLKGTVVMFFQGFNRMDGVAAVKILTNLTLLVSVPGFILFGPDLGGAITGYALGYGVAVAFGLFVIFTRFYDGHTASDEQTRDVSSRLLRYSVPLTFTKGANTIDTHADTILISLFRGPTAIAFYTLGKQIADFLIAPAQSLGFAISPTYGEQKANDALSHAASLYEQSFVYTVAFYGPAAAGVVLVAEPTVRLIFGPGYVGAGPVLQIFSLLVFVRALDKITSDALDYLGRASARAAAKGSLALANVVLNLLLIPPFGVVGAAVATVTTFSVLVAVELYVIADELPLDTARLLRTSLLVGGITLGMSVVVYPLSRSVSDIPSLVLAVGTGGTVWFVLAVLTGVLDLRQLSATLT